MFSVQALVCTATCLVLLTQVLPYPLAAASSEAALASCYNQHYNATPTRFEDFLKGRPSSLFIHKVFWSSKPSVIPVTVFAGATLSRLDALEAQCRSWRGPHASAVYVPLVQQQNGLQLTESNAKQLAFAEETVRAMFRRLEAEPTACQPRIQLVYEVLHEEAMLFILPINLLRNVAILPATAPLVAMIDVDLLVSESFSSVAQKSQSLSQVQEACASGAVVILPAFETHKRLEVEEGVALAVHAAAGGKPEVVALVQGGSLHYFAEFDYKRGHAPTNFSRWYQQSTGMYAVPYEVNYEPWFVMTRHDSPPYDVRFRGYGWNKVAQVAYVNATGHRFLVHPTAYVVHRPHPKSNARAFYTTAYTGSGAQQSIGADGKPVSLAKLFHRKVSAMRHVTIRDMRRSLYTPVADAQSQHCRQVLSWWRNRR